MNVVKVLGGLGNQLFQYAFGQVLLFRKKEAPLYDITWYDKVRIPPRPYRLNVFNLEVGVGKFSDNRETVREGKEITKFFKYKNNKNYHGYWQSPHYYNNTLRKKFSEQFHVLDRFYNQRFLDILEGVVSTNSVFVHVRRGDYLDNANHLCLPKSYYVQGIMLFSRILHNPTFYIFSDDLNWCKENLNIANCVFVDIDDYLAFELLRNCRHGIISNSTFSWWPAYLNDEGIIMSPDCWSRNGNTTFIHKGILLDKWIKLPIRDV